MLDGEHNTDEICATFNVGWAQVERWLAVAGGVQDAEAGEYGNVTIIYR